MANPSYSKDDEEFGGILEECLALKTIQNLRDYAILERTMAL